MENDTSIRVEYFVYYVILITWFNYQAFYMYIYSLMFLDLAYLVSGLVCK